MGLKQAVLGGHAHAGLHPNNVAGHQITAWYVQPIPVTQHHGGGFNHEPQCQRFALRLPFLIGADDGVDLKCENNEQGVAPFPQRDRDRRRDQKQGDEGVLKLRYINGDQ